MHYLAAFHQRSRVEIHCQITTLDCGGSVRATRRSAKQGSHSRLELVSAEGLSDIIVGARVQQAHLFLIRMARGENKNRCIRPLSDLGDHFEACPIWEAEIHDDQGRALSRGEVDPACTRIRFQHAVEVALQRVPDDSAYRYEGEIEDPRSSKFSGVSKA